MAVITLPLKSPREEESTPSSRMLISADHHRPAGNLSPTGTRANSLPVRVPYALQRRFTWPPRAATPEDHASYQEDYFMAKSLGMYNRLLAAGLNVNNIHPDICFVRNPTCSLRCLSNIFSDSSLSSQAIACILPAYSFLSGIISLPTPHPSLLFFPRPWIIRLPMLTLAHSYCPQVQSPATVDEVLPEAVDDSVDDETAGILFTIDDCTTALDFQ